MKTNSQHNYYQYYITKAHKQWIKLSELLSSCGINTILKIRYGTQISVIIIKTTLITVCSSPARLAETGVHVGLIDTLAAILTWVAQALVDICNHEKKETINYFHKSEMCENGCELVTGLTRSSRNQTTMSAQVRTLIAYKMAFRTQISVFSGGARCMFKSSDDLPTTCLSVYMSTYLCTMDVLNTITSFA